MPPAAGTTLEQALATWANRVRRGIVPSVAAVRRHVRVDGPWEPWRDAFNRLHHEAPAAEVRLARACRAAARAERRALLAARFLLLEGRGLLRSGRPRDAGRTLARAARELRGLDEVERAAQADVAAVDALAHGGSVRAALTLAERAARALRRRSLAPWRDFLAVNRANALRLAGDLEAAERALRAAASRLERRGDRATATIARLNAGVAALEAGDPERAHADFEAAQAAFEALGRPEMAREARYDGACADVRRGRLGSAVRALESLAREHEGAGSARAAGLCRMDLADALLRAGDAPTAAEEAERAARAFEQAGAAAEAVEAGWIGAAALARQDPAAAARAAASVRRRAQRLGRAALVLRCSLVEADLAAAAGRPWPGRALGGLARRARAAGQTEIAHQAVLLEASACLRRGAVVRARTLLAGLGRARAAPRLHAARRVLEAEVLTAGGRLAAALRRLQQATASSALTAADLPGGWLRATFLIESLDPWLARVDLLLARGAPADRREALATLDRIAAERFHLVARVSVGDARALRLRKRLEALYDRLGRGAGPTRGLRHDEVDRLRVQARRLETELARLLRRRERQGPPAGVPRPPPRATTRGSKDVAARMHLWRHGGRVRGLLRRPDGSVVGWDLGDGAGLAAAVERLGFHARRSRLQAATGDDPSHVAFEAACEALARRCLGPLLEGPLPARLHATCDPTLPDLPLELLPVCSVPLACATGFVRVPGPTARVVSRRRGRGVTWIALGDADLPGLAREATGLASSARIRSGGDATRAALREALGGCERVHVAGHGLDGGACPALGGVRLHDGWFGSADLPPAVVADVVVLGACRTGRAAGLGSLAWGGLPHALLALGARHVVWTADDVDDEATATLTTRLDQALRSGADVPHAFGRALAATAAVLGSVAALLPFRLSGIPT